jgi:Cu/Ag efflux protein CusF
MQKASSRRTALALLSGALVLAALPAQAAVGHDRGMILNIDLTALQVQIKDAKDRDRIWPIAKDATVKFSVESWAHRTSTLKDLRKGMYVHFEFKTGDPEVIQGFDVRDLNQDGGASAAPAPTPTPADGHTARVTAVDTRVAQIEVMLDQGGRKTYQAANAGVLAGVKAGQRVTLVTEPRNGQDVVVRIKR